MKSASLAAFIVATCLTTSVTSASLRKKTLDEPEIDGASPIEDPIPPMTCDEIIASTAWEGSEALNPAHTFTTKWKRSEDGLSITLMASAIGNNPTWIGLGISEVGHMLGSDVYTLSMNDAAIDFQDGYVPWFSLLPEQLVPRGMRPIRDMHQDASLICSYKDEKRLTMVFSRLIDTQDGQDRVIKPGNNPVIYAWGVNTDELHYHGGNRGSTGLTFFDKADTSDPPDTDGHIDLILSEGFITSPQAHTQYICQSFDVGAEPRHIVAADVVLHGESIKLAHHIVVHACGNTETDMYKMHYGAPGVCQDPNDLHGYGTSPLGSEECVTLLFGWNKGGTKMVLPPLAGLPIGGYGSRYIIVEIHIDNPTHIARNTAQLGVKLSITSKLRTYNAASMATGDYHTSMYKSKLQPSAVPPLSPHTHYETTCSSKCTSTWKGEIHVFASMLHLHMVGKSIYLTKTTDGSTSLLEKRQFWNAGYQALEPQSYSVAPGDQLNLHCTYDTTNYPEEVKFGHDATEEMCMAYLFYYPAAYGTRFCGFYADQSTCGGMLKTIDEVNPIPDGWIDIPLSEQFGVTKYTHPPTGVPSAAPSTSTPTSPTCKPTASPSTVKPTIAPAPRSKPTRAPKQSKA